MSEVLTKGACKDHKGTEIKCITIDANEAASFVAFKASEVIAIYPITPSSPMGEWADAWMSANYKNIWCRLLRLNYYVAYD